MGIGDKIVRKLLIDDLNKSLEDGLVFMYEGVMMAYNKGKYYTSFYISESGININDYEPYPLDIDYMDIDELKTFVKTVKKNRINLKIEFISNKNKQAINEIAVKEVLPI
ncbi:MAG: hypothetical protein ACRC7N_02955 [Clostridium sp.]